MKQEFQMSEEEMQAIKDISKDNTPVIFVGYWAGLDKQERANKIWGLMGEKYGFDAYSVEPSAKGDRFFLAIPNTIVVPKTPEEIEMDKYNTLQKIVDQLMSCDFESQAGHLHDNIAFKQLKRLASND